ncbi:homeotic protein female sterile-like [Drosophila gunungcola]|uniref:homeotic protein female sterile-like n=1 Tax=Drosophila gunungcola TaxID=103775 RepID=UPI0022E2A43C|nr:homeotic protein female sterile-like [Drosophila gunungcola]
MSARSSNTQQQVEHEVREERAREQPVANEADEESTGEISDVELPAEEEDVGPSATEVGEVVDISSDESGPEDASEKGTETVSPEVSSDEDDAARRAARDRMVFRRLSRATAGLGRICLGQIPPSGKPKEWARILEERAITVRQWEARRPPQEQLQSPEEQMQPPLSTTCADATSTATPAIAVTAATLTITTTIAAAEAAGVAPATGAGRASAADRHGGGAAVSSADGHVDEARARGGSRGGQDAGGHRVAAPTAVEPARSEGQVGETRRENGRSRGTGGDAREGARGPGGAGEGAMGVAITAGDVEGRGATPEAGAADLVSGAASLTGEADAAETAVGGRGTVVGGSGGGVAGAGGLRSATAASGPSSCWTENSATE